MGVVSGGGRVCATSGVVVSNFEGLGEQPEANPVASKLR